MANFYKKWCNINVIIVSPSSRSTCSNIHCPSNVTFVITCIRAGNWGGMRDETLKLNITPPAPPHFLTLHCTAGNCHTPQDWTGRIDVCFWCPCFFDLCSIADKDLCLHLYLLAFLLSSIAGAGSKVSIIEVKHSLLCENIGGKFFDLLMLLWTPMSSFCLFYASSTH